MSGDENNRVFCAECGRNCDKERFITVDGKPVCSNCLYGDVSPFTLFPIGVVVNDKKCREKGLGTCSETDSDVSEIHLCAGMARFMKGLARETHLTVVWHLHQAKPVRTVFARGWDGKKVGPFASRTPNRPTPIAITEVELLKVKGTTLIVRGLDAINGTPVLDIKVAMRSLKKEPRKE